MNHTEAVESLATERYLLGEMAGTERDAYESHFFDCQVCAADVRDGAAFVDNIQEVFRERQRAARRDSARSAGKRTAYGRLWFPALAAAAALVFALLVGYQNLVTIPSMRSLAEPQELSSVMLRTVRGELPTVSLPKGRTHFHLLVDMNTEENYASYRCDFRAEQGDGLFSMSAVPRSGTLSLLVPAARFPDGTYVVDIFGIRSPQDATAVKLESHSFSVRRGEEWKP